MSTGDDPQFADGPAGRADDYAATGGRSIAGPSVLVPPASGGKAIKRRKSRRRRRGPVYASNGWASGSNPPLDPVNGHANGAGADGAAEPAAGAIAVAPIVAPSLRERAHGPLYAALDLGTNNCRLLVATPRDYGFRVVDAFSRIVRLGEGIGANGCLGEAAMARAIEALGVCSSKLAEHDVRRTRLIATEACRSADNGADFIARVRAETGLQLEVVSRETEARLAVAGCASLVDPNATGVLLFDIGGGSSELVWIDLTPAPDGRRRRMADRIRTWMSLPVGVVSISERHGGRHVSPGTFADMVAEVSEMLTDFPEVEALDRAVAGGGIHMLGTSGTVTTLAGIHLGLPRYDRRRVDGTWLAGNMVADLIQTLVGMDYETRMANPCIGRERADLVLAGCAILEAIRQRWPCDRLRVADRGLREGMLVELMAEDGRWHPRPRRRAP